MVKSKYSTFRGHADRHALLEAAVAAEIAIRRRYLTAASVRTRVAARVALADAAPEEALQHSTSHINILYSMFIWFSKEHSAFLYITLCALVNARHRQNGFGTKYTKIEPQCPSSSKSRVVTEEEEEKEKEKKKRATSHVAYNMQMNRIESDRIES